MHQPTKNVCNVNSALSIVHSFPFIINRDRRCATDGISGSNPNIHILSRRGNLWSSLSNGLQHENSGQLLHSGERRLAYSDSAIFVCTWLQTRVQETWRLLRSSNMVVLSSDVYREYNSRYNGYSNVILFDWKHMYIMYICMYILNSLEVDSYFPCLLPTVLPASRSRLSSRRTVLWLSSPQLLFFVPTVIVSGATTWSLVTGKNSTEWSECLPN